MLRSNLQDAAVSAAKGHSHPQVECRHVLLAVAEHFRHDRNDGDSLFSWAKAALDPPGTFFGLPPLSPEATALLDSLSSEDDAIQALLGAFTSAKGDADLGAPSHQTELVPEKQPNHTGSPEDRPDVENENTEAVLSELHELIGLGQVKNRVRETIAVVEANRVRKKAGQPAVSSGLHLVFSGPPGTGKTTVARLVARLYKATGALPGAGFKEATRDDFVAGYVGQTANKTSRLIEQARPGVLFVDEAYSLRPTHESDFGGEAIAALVKAMEDHRDDFAVIVAGYREEMSDLIRSNPGLRSRFKTFIDFPHYSPEELTSIFVVFAQDKDIAVAEGVLPKVKECFQQAVGKPGFGNARYARNLFENAFARMAMRAAEDGLVESHELQEIVPEDIVCEDDGGIRKTTPRIGFGPAGRLSQDE